MGKWIRDKNGRVLPCPEVVGGAKACTTCGTKKPITEFYFNRKKGKENAECKACNGLRQIKHRELNTTTFASIYYLRNDKNNEIFYVGQTTQSFNWRLSGYSRRSGKKFAEYYKANKAWVSMHLIEECEKEIKDLREAYWITQYFTMGHKLINTQIPKIACCPNCNHKFVFRQKST